MAHSEKPNIFPTSEAAPAKKPVERMVSQTQLQKTIKRLLTAALAIGFFACTENNAATSSDSSTPDSNIPGLSDSGKPPDSSSPEKDAAPGSDILIITDATNGDSAVIIRDAGVSDATISDTAIPDTSAPDAATGPDATEVPDAARPDASILDTSTPDAAEADSSEPDTSITDTLTLEDANQPIILDANAPDSGMPDSNPDPDASNPDTSNHDAEPADVDINPDASATPDAQSLADASELDASEPDASIPDSGPDSGIHIDDAGHQHYIVSTCLSNHQFVETTRPVPTLCEVNCANTDYITRIWFEYTKTPTTTTGWTFQWLPSTRSLPIPYPNPAQLQANGISQSSFTSQGIPNYTAIESGPSTNATLEVCLEGQGNFDAYDNFNVSPSRQAVTAFTSANSPLITNADSYSYTSTTGPNGTLLFIHP